MKKMRDGYYLSTAVLACALSVLSSPAHAQSTSTPAPTPLSPFASVTALGQTLAHKGIFLNLSYTEDVSSLVSGGVKAGTMPIGQASASVVFDLQTLLGITGASFHVGFDERNGIPIGSAGGIASTDAILQADAGPIKYRLSDFYWEQGFDRDRLDIEAGRMQPTSDFAFSDISCQFVSSIICAQPGTWYLSNGNEPYGTGEWGGRANFAITPQVYIRAGVYDDDPSQGGFESAGFDWNLEHSTGVFVPVELGYQTSFTDAQYPAKYDVGFYDDTSSSVSPTYTEANGTLLGGETHQGRTAVWVQAQKTVCRPDRSTNQSLTLFGGAMIYNGNAPYNGQYYVGLFDRAPIASRPRDTIGLIASLYDINSDYHPNHPTSVALELNYGVSIIPGVTFKPYVQYVVDPFTYTEPVGYTEPSNDLVVGFQLALNFTDMFDFPQFTPH